MRFVRDLLRRENGMTITELATVLAVLLIVLAAFLTVVETLNESVIVQQERSDMNDQARLALERLDREVRSASVLYDPAVESPANFRFRIYTQANATTRTPALTCVQWEIRNQTLYRRWWPPAQPASASAWRPVASGIVNRDVSPQVPAFALDPDPAKAGRTVDIRLLVDADTADPRSAPVRIQTSLSGRNGPASVASGACEQNPVG